MRLRKANHGEVPAWASPFLYRSLPYDGTEKDAIKLDIFFYLPDTKIIVEGTDVLLVREWDGTLGFVDIEREHVFRLRSPTYATALALLGKPLESIGVYRNYITETSGFWINPRAPLVVMFDDDTITPKEALPSTLLLATPTRLWRRIGNTQEWEALITCMPSNKQTVGSKHS